MVVSDRHVVWHDLECGAYRADLPLWLELADAHPHGAILDIGAGTGRVALELARHGRRVIALDRDPVLLCALRRRTEGLDVETLCADARSFALPRDEQIALCVAPMQTVQLLGGPDGRAAFLRRVRATLAPSGLLACAIVVELEPFDCAEDSSGPSPETCRLGDTLYTSQATRVEVGPGTIAIERHRHTDRPTAAERDLIELDRIDAVQLEREGSALGLRPAPALHVPPTADHSGSTVVMLRA
jgi:SAM-dependent methyltransferase